MTKAKILLVCDVPNWAWAHKSSYIKKYLSDEFDFDIVYAKDTNLRQISKTKYDLYFTYGYAFVNPLRGVPIGKLVTGVTAPRPKEKLIPAFKSAVAVHANSMQLYRQIKKLHKKVFYVPNGVDEKLFRPTKPIPKNRKNIRVGNTSKLHPTKGQEAFIRPAVKITQAEYVCRHAKYHNAIPLKRMVPIYQEMDIMVVASINDGTPCPMLEAAACGRPIIANKIGNSPEFIKNGYNGFLVPRKIEAYVEKIQWMRSHRKEMRIMGNNARKTILESWTWKIQAENYRKMFRELL